MNQEFHVMGIRTGIIHPGDPVADIILDAVTRNGQSLEEGDVLVMAESAIATSEGRLVELKGVVPSDESRKLAAEYGMDPREVEVVIRESDRIIGGIPGFLLCMKGGTLLPNAGVDASNAPPGFLVPLPEDPDGSADRIRREILKRKGLRVGVIIADSRTHAMRVGCSGVAIGCSGIPSVIDDRGRCDLYGRALQVTRRAVADNIATAAELVMGEADECTPLAIVRGLGLPLVETSGIEGIAAEECLFMGTVLDVKRRDRY